ncbi:hypothetical protein [Agrococcus sp. KRD186]|uniref:hypothetical protein n=1 Tax=Agrococcus sp. KRD186 TaxID=2729730 RepID=UPI0019D110D4|nr:hypothetical protein [Agrococcus sp. KRD186]
MRQLIGQGRNRRRLLLGVIAIAVLLVVDAVLIFWALGAHRQSGELGEAPQTPAPSESQPVGETSIPAPSGTAETASTSVRLLSAVSGSVAWRAVSGICGEPGSVEVTSDSGRTWTAAGLQVQGEVLSLEPNPDGRRGVAVVGNADCEPVAHRTFTAGVGWEESPDQGIGNCIAPDGQLVLQGQRADSPCDEPVALAGAGGGVVLCDDMAQARTGAGAWVAVAQNVTALGPSSAGVAIAMRSEACEGLEIGVVTGGETRTTCSDVPADTVVAVSAFNSVV